MLWLELHGWSRWRIRLLLLRLLRRCLAVRLCLSRLRRLGVLRLRRLTVLRLLRRRCVLRLLRRRSVLRLGRRCVLSLRLRRRRGRRGELLRVLRRLWGAVEAPRLCLLGHLWGGRCQAVATVAVAAWIRGRAAAIRHRLGGRCGSGRRLGSVVASSRRRGTVVGPRC